MPPESAYLPPRPPAQPPKPTIVQTVPHFFEAHPEKADLFRSIVQEYSGLSADPLDPVRIIQFFYLIEAANELPPGDYLELGTYGGLTLKVIHKLMDAQRTLYALDTFEGFDARDIKVERTKYDYTQELEWFSRPSIENVIKYVGDGAPPPNLKIVKGWFPQSFTGLESIRWRFVHIDLDLYQPIKAALQLLWHSLVPGGIILVHDYGCYSFRAARMAVDEFCESVGHAPVEMPDRWGSAVLRKPTSLKRAGQKHSKELAELRLEIERVRETTAQEGIRSQNDSDEVWRKQIVFEREEFARELDRVRNETTESWCREIQRLRRDAEAERASALHETNESSRQAIEQLRRDAEAERARALHDANESWRRELEQLRRDAEAERARMLHLLGETNTTWTYELEKVRVCAAAHLAEERSRLNEERRAEVERVWRQTVEGMRLGPRGRRLVRKIVGSIGQFPQHVGSILFDLPTRWLRRTRTLLVRSAKFLARVKELRRRARVAKLPPSPYFDAAYYLRENPELSNESDLYQHFIQRGWREGRNPSAIFNVNEYLEQNAEVARLNINPLYHFLIFKVGRPESPEVRELLLPYFDANFYRATYPDVPAGCDLYEHFMSLGWREGRDPSAKFSVNYYLIANRDVAEAKINPLVHYVQLGIREGRSPQLSAKEQHFESYRKEIAPHFDASYYLSRAPDPTAWLDPYLHFMLVGWREGRNPSENFDVSYYLGKYVDVTDNPLYHYVLFGAREGRRTQPGRRRPQPDVQPLGTYDKGEMPRANVAFRTPDSGLARVLFLSYGYMESGRLEPYREAIAQLLAAAGCHVLTIKTNSFFHDYSHEARSSEAVAAVVDSVRTFEPNVVISINRTGLHAQVQAVLPSDIKIITWFQDPHYYATPELLRFNSADMLWFIYPNEEVYDNTLKSFAQQHGAMEKQIFNVPFCLDDLTFYDRRLPRTHDICFVASSFATDFASLLLAYRLNPSVRSALLAAYLRKKEDPGFDIISFLAAKGVDFCSDAGSTGDNAIITSLRTGRLNLQGLFDDQINLERRLRHLAALAEFDLIMYGQKDEYWVPQMAIVEPKLLKAYQFAGIDEPTKLAELYCRSKIGFNISRIAAANAGFSFRVPEVMACGAVLMTEGFARPALTAQGFEDGKDYVSYNSPEDLQRKCREFLASPDQLRAIALRAGEKLKAIANKTSLTQVLAQSLHCAGLIQVAERLAALKAEDIHTSDFARIAFFGDFKGNMPYGLVTDISAHVAGTDPGE